MNTINRSRLMQRLNPKPQKVPKVFKARRIARSLLSLIFLKLIFAVMFIILFSSGMNKNSFQN